MDISCISTLSIPELLPHSFNSYIMRTEKVDSPQCDCVRTARVGRAQKLSLSLTSSEIGHKEILLLFLTVPLLLQLLVLNAYQGQLVLMERRHFPHLLQSLALTQLTPTHLMAILSMDRFMHSSGF